MKVVRSEDVPYEERPTPIRGGKFAFKRLLEGKPRSTGNFFLNMATTEADFVSPRHRHNFDQVRLQIDGFFDYDRNGKMTPGTIGYFPEGTHYGPQTSSDGARIVVLQVGGPSRNGYMSETELAQGMAELAKLGEFKDGVFRRRDDVDGKRNLDAYQAIWEHVNGRPMIYPKQRYSSPILMDPANYNWVPTKEDGVSEKLLGVFSEVRTEIALLRIEAGAVHETVGNRIYLSLNGAGTAGNDYWSQFTAIHVDESVGGKLAASQATEFMVLGLPKFDAALPMAAE
jgi:hypothetical protein